MLTKAMHFNVNNDFINIKTEDLFTNFCKILDYSNDKIKLYNFIKLQLNIIYYDENLKNTENNLNTSFFKLNIKGTFYGCHNFQLFKYILRSGRAIIRKLEGLDKGSLQAASGSG